MCMIDKGKLTALKLLSAFKFSTTGLLFFILFLYAIDTSVASAQVSANANKKKSDVHWSRLINIMKQMDSIDRESWWVLTGQRPLPMQSLFGKVMRAAQSEEKIKLTQKHLFSCDKYFVQRNIMTAIGYPQNISMSNACFKSKNLFAEIMWIKQEQLSLTFNPEPLSDVLGLGASILGRKITCEIKTNENGIVEKYSCKNMIKNKSKAETIELETYEFDKLNNNQITLKGSVTEELKVKRKIETVVPLAGKIVVTETEVLPPQGYRHKTPAGAVQNKNRPTPIATPELNPNSAVAPANQSSAPAPGAAPARVQSTPPMNPDILVQKIIEEHNAKSTLPEPDYIEDTKAQQQEPALQQEQQQQQEYPAQPTAPIEQNEPAVDRPASNR